MRLCELVKVERETERENEWTLDNFFAFCFLVLPFFFVFFKRLPKIYIYIINENFKKIIIVSKNLKINLFKNF